MNSKKGPIIAALVFLGCLIAGFVVTTELKPEEPVDGRGQVEDIIRRVESFCDTVEHIDPATKDTIIMEICTATLFDDSVTNKGDTIPGIGIPGELTEREIGRKVFIADNEPGDGGVGVPTRPTPPRPTPNPVPIHVEPTPVAAKMSTSEFQGLINNTSDNILEGIGNDKVSGHVRISVSGYPDVQRVGGVREKIETGMWKGVRVIRLESDPKTGKIIGATVEPR